MSENALCRMYTIEFTRFYERVLDALMPKVWQGMLTA